MDEASAPRQRRERGSLTPEEILEGAFRFAEQNALDNLDELSMPELARHLDVGVTSIYWHFRRKEDLIRAMCGTALDAVQELLPNPATATTWREFLETYYTAMRDIYRADNILADLVLIKTHLYPLEQTHGVYRRFEKIVQMLVDWGFAPAQAWRVNGALTIYTQGIILQERSQRNSRSPTLDSRQAKLLDPPTMPLISALYDEGSISLAIASDDDFAFGLRMLLDSASRLHDDGQSAY